MGRIDFGQMIWYIAMDEAFRARVKADFMHDVIRERVILNRAKQAGVNMLVMGAGHVDAMWLGCNESTDWLATQGIDEIASEKPRIGGIGYGLAADEQAWLERQILFRQHNAVTQGLIRPDVRPDYVGYFFDWQRRVPVAGLFQVHWDPNSGIGVVFDQLGDAMIAGTINDRQVTFLKQYENHLIPLEAASMPIEYDGVWQGEQYVGEWSYHGRRDTFVMRPYTPDLRVTWKGFE